MRWNRRSKLFRRRKIPRCYPARRCWRRLCPRRARRRARLAASDALRPRRREDAKSSLPKQLERDESARAQLPKLLERDGNARAQLPKLLERDGNAKAPAPKLPARDGNLRRNLRRYRGSSSQSVTHIRSRKRLVSLEILPAFLVLAYSLFVHFS
jgi:hypothetical protein